MRAYNILAPLCSLLAPAFRHVNRTSDHTRSPRVRVHFSFLRHPPSSTSRLSALAPCAFPTTAHGCPLHSNRYLLFRCSARVQLQISVPLCSCPFPPDLRFGERQQQRVRPLDSMARRSSEKRIQHDCCWYHQVRYLDADGLSSLLSSAHEDPHLSQFEVLAPALGVPQHFSK